MKSSNRKIHDNDNAKRALRVAPTLDENGRERMSLLDYTINAMLDVSDQAEAEGVSQAELERRLQETAQKFQHNLLRSSLQVLKR